VRQKCGGGDAAGGAIRIQTAQSYGAWERHCEAAFPFTARGFGGGQMAIGGVWV
jgi:hypothetical protein